MPRAAAGGAEPLAAGVPPSGRPGRPLPARATVRRRGPADDAALRRSRATRWRRLLGRGGMGVVFRARHLRLNRPVALKMMLAGAYAGPRERERFQREAEAVAGLRHPNVVQVYDVGDADGRPYFTMEFVEGGSLAQKLTGHAAAGRTGRRNWWRPWPAAVQVGPRRRDRPPRPEAGQRAAHRRRHAQGHRLRAGPPAVRRGRADPDRRRPRHAELHGPGAGRRARRTRSGRRRTCTRSGRSCTSCSPAGRRSAARPPPRPFSRCSPTTRCRPSRLNAARAPRPGDHLPEVPPEGAAAAVRHRRRAGRRPRPVPAGRGDRRPARRPGAAVGPAGPPPAASCRRRSPACSCWPSPWPAARCGSSPSGRRSQRAAEDDLREMAD